MHLQCMGLVQRMIFAKTSLRPQGTKREAIQKNRVRMMDCFVPTILAMTIEIFTNYSCRNKIEGEGGVNR